jgi:hypothetical protein
VEQRPSGLLPSAVGEIPQDREPDRGEVEADLVLAAGLELDLEERSVHETLEDAESGPGLP